MAGAVEELEGVTLLGVILIIGVIIVIAVLTLKDISLSSIPGFSELTDKVRETAKKVLNSPWSTQDNGDNGEYPADYNPTVGEQAVAAYNYGYEGVMEATDPYSVATSLGIIPDQPNATVQVLADSIPDSVRADWGDWLQKVGIF
jgi:hypothetical protein